MMTLWGHMLGRDVDLIIYEDNEATEKVVRSGFSHKLRHITRTHKVNLSSLKEIVDQPDVTLQHVKTKDQRADIFTKGVEAHKWANAIHLLEKYPQ